MRKSNCARSQVRIWSVFWTLTALGLVWRTVSSCDVVFSIAPAVWRSKLNLAFCTDFMNDWEIETTHWQNTHSKFHKFWFPISNHRRFWKLLYIQDGPLLIWPRNSTVVFQWAMKGGKQKRTLNANSIDRTSLPISLDQIYNLLHKSEQISQLHLRHYNTFNVCLSEWNDTAPTGRSFVKSDIGVFFKISLENSSFVKIWQE